MQKNEKIFKKRCTNEKNCARIVPSNLFFCPKAKENNNEEDLRR